MSTRMIVHFALLVLLLELGKNILRNEVQESLLGQKIVMLI